MTDASPQMPSSPRWTRLCVGVFLLTVGIGGGTVFGQPRPDVTSWVEPDTIVSGEPFIFNVTANTPAHRAVWFPEADADSSVFGPLTVLRRSAVHNRSVGVMYAIDSVAYTVTTTARGSVRIPPIPIRVDAAADTVVTQTQPFTVPVVSRGAETVLSVSSSAASTPVGMVGWGLLGLALVGLGGGFYLWYRDDAEPPTAPEADTEGSAEPTRSSYEEAREELETLKTQSLAETDAIESLYVTLSGTITAYLSQRLHVATRERTTSELLVLLRQHQEVPQSAVDRLRHVLEEADLVKFAGRRPEADVAREHVREALVVLDVLEKESAPGGPPSPPGGTAGPPERGG